MRAYIALGSNLGDRELNLFNALKALIMLNATSLERVSRVYETEPVGCDDCEKYLNMCAEVKTEFSPHALLGALLGIEAANGRERPYINSPRTLDLDLLIYENERINTRELTLPHPRMKERAFVLVPLSDINKELKFGELDFSKDYSLLSKDGVETYSPKNSSLISLLKEYSE
ncbi:MAG: 2-amino-4-hydroxy-6-hydroxymethyldihydropteridine diphosphokinase [Clostridiales bacterium]|jgi:2-amino-4-hydroxy-6-hydroxymethyldihydropteridine diphosphokinase|nr:2-amino-4-hydroxy-6-hydroxymethyldihydropteridine diphosphokinase [Clostridiales bacterium]